MKKTKRYWPSKRTFGGKKYNLLSVHKGTKQSRKTVSQSNIYGANHRVVSGKTIRYYPGNTKKYTAKKGKSAVYGRLNESKIAKRKFK